MSAIRSGCSRGHGTLSPNRSESICILLDAVLSLCSFFHLVLSPVLFFLFHSSIYLQISTQIQFPLKTLPRPSLGLASLLTTLITPCKFFFHSAYHILNRIFGFVFFLINVCLFRYTVCSHVDRPGLFYSSLYTQHQHSTYNIVGAQ